jgi:2,3-bisphosphoglycerate-dependent phosphoglycerate mutase
LSTGGTILTVVSGEWRDLTERMQEQAGHAGVMLDEFDRIVALNLTVTPKIVETEAMGTLNIVLGELDREWLPAVKTWKLNERHYGALQGLDKTKTARQYGDAQVKIWRRSFDVRPPQLSETDPRNPRNPRLQSQYRNEASEVLPLGESLADTVARVIPYFNQVIKPEIARGRRVVIAAHGNSLRALVMYFERLSQPEIIGVDIPTGVPLVYEFDANWEVVRKGYLGDQDSIRTKIENVARQGMNEN